MNFCSMKRKELQTLCKKNGIPANLSNVEMANRLAAILKVKKQKMFKSCLKNLETVISSDDESDRVKIKGRKRVKFSPENETFEFEKTDPRELRLLARKRRSMAKSELGKNPVIVSAGNLVAECEEVGSVDEVVERNLRGKSMVRSNVVFVCQDVSKMAKHAEKENQGRCLRSHSRKAEHKNVETALLSLCAEKKAERRRKGDEGEKGGVVDRADRPSDKIADHIGNTHMVTRRSLRSNGITAENLAKSAGGGGGVLERSKLIEKDLNKKGENILQVPRRSVRHAKKAKGGDLTSVSEGSGDDKSSDDGGAKNHTDNRVEMALDSRKRKRAGKKAANGKHQSFEEVSHGYADQQNGNAVKPVDAKAFVGRRLRSREVVVESLGKAEVGEFQVFPGECLMRKSIRRRAKNDEKDESSTAAQTARRPTRQTGKVTVDASLSAQVADDAPQSVDDMNQSDNQGAQLAHEASEAIHSIMEKTDAVIMDDSPFSEQSIPGDACEDHSIEETTNKKVEGQCHTTLGSASNVQKKEESDRDIQVCTNSPKQLCVACDTKRPEDCIGSNDSDEKAPANVGADTCSAARSDGPVLPLLRKSSDCEAKCSPQVNNNLVGPLKLLVATVDDFQGGIISAPESISARKFSVLLAADNFADVSEPVFHSPARPATPGDREVFNADCELSYSGTDLGYRNMGSEKVASNSRERVFNHSSNEKLSGQINRLEESSFVNKANKSENAIKNQMLDHPAAVAHKIDEQVVDQEEAAGARERCERVSRKTECTTREVFGGQGLNQSVSQEKGLVGDEANSEANAQHYSTLDRSTLSAEALLATVGELMEEDAEAKTVTPLHNRVAGTSSRGTEERKMEASEHKDGCEDMSLFSIVGNNLYLQSQVEGDFTAALGLPKKGEESYKETFGGLAGFQNRRKQNDLVQNDEVTSVKQLEAADGFAYPLLLSIVFKDDATNPCENKELESEKAAVVSNSDKDVDSAINESSQCFSTVSGKSKYLKQSSGKVVEGHEADTSPYWNGSRNPVQGQEGEPLQANWASYSGNVISGGDVKRTRNEVSESTSVTKRVILVKMPEISVRHDDNSANLVKMPEISVGHDGNSANLRSRASTVPSGIMEEEVHKISQVQDKSSLIETKETSQSSEILHDSFTGYELECTVENVDVFPCKSAEVNESVSKLFTNDMHNASENPGEEKLVEAASTNRTGCKGLCSIPFSVLNQETEAKDSIFPLPLKPHPLVGNEKVTNELEDPMQDDSEVRCLPSLDDCVGTNNVNVSPKATKHGEVNNSEGLCITESPGNEDLQKSPCVCTEVSDALVDPGTCNSEEVEFARDQGNTKREPQNVNGELLSSHVHNVNEAAILIANDHLASERPADLQRSMFGLDGIHFALGHVEHEENVSPACGADIEELQIDESLCPEDHYDKGNELDSMGEKLIALPSKLRSADEKTVEASMNYMHDMPGDAGDRELFEATNIREMGYHVICSSPSSPINGDTHNVRVKGDDDADKAEAQDIVCPAELEPLSFGRNEKPIDEIEGALCDASEIGCASLLDDSLGTSKDKIALKESELGEVKSSENACMTRGDDSASDRQNDLRSSSCGRADVADVVIDHGKMNTFEEVEADAEINYEHVKGYCNADQAVTRDVFYPAVFESQLFGGNEKKIDQTGRALHDASEYRCALLWVDSQGTGKDNIARKESELCEVRNPEDACMTRSDHLASERQKDLWRSSGGMTVVSDVVMDHEKMDNSEEVDANRDQGNSRIGQQNINGGQLDVLLQEKASATATDHAAFEVSEDSRSLPRGHDGICSVQRIDYKENGCPAKIEEPLCVAVIDYHDAEGVAMNSVTVDEKALQVLMNSIHGTTENFSEKELVEAATIREMGCRDLHSGPFSIISWDANIEGVRCDTDQGGTMDLLHPAMVELEPQFSGSYEKVTKKAEEASEDTSAFRSSPSIHGCARTSKLDVVLRETEHGEVHSLEDACLIGRDDLASEKPEDLRTASCEIAEVSDVTEHGKSNSSEVVCDADQALNSSYELELDQHMLLKDDKSKEGHNVVSVERVVEIVTPASLLINSRNSEAVGDMHSNPGSSGGHKLSDATEVNEMAQKAVSNYPCSTPKPETSYESFKGNSEHALEKLEDSTSIGMHDHSFSKMPENEGVLFDDLEDRCLNMVDHSVAEYCSVVKSKEGEHANPVESAEMSHIAVEHFFDPCGMGTENVLGGKDNNDDNSNKAGTFSPSPCAFDNVTDAVQKQNASPSMSGSQRLQSAESLSAARAGNTALHVLDTAKCKDQKCSVESHMFSSSEIGLIWRNMTEYNNSGNTKHPVTEQTVSGKELVDDGHLRSSTHCKQEDMDERNGTENEVADDRTVNQETQPAEEQVIELKLLLNPSRENPDYANGNMNEIGRTDEHPSCPQNAKNSGEIPQNAKDIPAIDQADSKVTKSSMIKRKNSRSILIHGTLQKPPLFSL